MEADLIITSQDGFTDDTGGRPIPDGAVAVRSGAIVGIGPAAEIAADWSTARKRSMRAAA